MSGQFYALQAQQTQAMIGNCLSISVTPELSELLCHVSRFLVSFQEHLLELLKVPEAAVAVLQISLRCSQGLSSMFCLQRPCLYIL